MRKKLFFVLALIIMAVSACGTVDIGTAGTGTADSGIEYEKYQADFTGLFNTYTIIVGYAEDKEQFEAYAQVVYDKLYELHKLFDIYYDYEGIANIKTINNQAGQAPVEVDQIIIDLLTICKQAYEDTNGAVNVTMGPVLNIWHEYREAGLDDPENAMIPSMEELQEALHNTNIEDLVIDAEAKTVFLKNPGMSLDVGALAKGYAVDIAAEAARSAGAVSMLINAGGNVIAIGKPLDNTRDRWGIGIQDPELSADGANNVLDTIYLNDAAVISSGDYQRYYIVDGKTYHHIIDPSTLIPASRYAAVSVVHESSGIGDMLSTAIYILPMDEGRAIIEKHGAEALWVMHDKSLVATDGYKAISKTLGGYSAVDKK